MGPKISPTKNKRLSNLLSSLLMKLLAIPLIPISLPLNRKNINTAKPIINPPINAEIGVKLTIFI